MGKHSLHITWSCEDTQLLKDLLEIMPQLKIHCFNVVIYSNHPHPTHPKLDTFIYSLLYNSKEMSTNYLKQVVTTKAELSEFGY